MTRPDSPAPTVDSAAVRGHEAPRARPALSRVLHQGRMETGTALRNGEQLLVTLILPALVLVGLTTTGLLGKGTDNGVDVAMPGVLALAVLSSAFTSPAIGTGFERRYNVLASLATTPLGSAGLILGKVLSVLAVLVLQVIVLGGLGLALGWRPELAGLLPAVLLLVAGVFAFTSLGLLLAGTARPEATLALANLAWVLLGAVGGSALPAPEALSWVSWLPSGALGDGLRAALIDGAWDPIALLVLLAWGGLALALAVRFFRWRP